MTVHVVVPVFNCPDGLVRCLSSLVVQEHADMTVTIIDDASTDDRVAPLLDAAVDQWGWTLIRNGVNQRCPANLLVGIDVADPAPHDVILLLDGDDWFPHGQVVDRIAEIHSNPSTWLAYGSYTPWPPNPACHPAEAYPIDVLHARSFRSAQCLFNHPLSFKRFLWDALPHSEMQDDVGRWLTTSYDETIMYGMLEMAARNTHFESDVLYVYNADNPLSETRARLDETVGVGEMLRARPALPLMSLAGDHLVPAATDGEPACDIS